MTPQATPVIRPATVDDLEAINAIYNYYVQTSTCTYDYDPCSPAERLAWFEEHGPAHPVTVAECDGQVVGWGSLSPFRSRRGYRHTVENSIYIRHDRHRRGLGRAILLDQIARARAAGHHVLVAGISAEQTASIRLHEAHGFVHAARLKEVGRKFDQWLDVVFMQLIL
ncbi:MAG: N-acetyltransferase [Phycisphaerae bacterium]